MICPECGCEFKKKAGNQKFCTPACDNRYRNKQRRNPKAEEPPELKPMKPLNEWIAEARECNLDYGNYRALIESGKTFEELKATAGTRAITDHAHDHKFL